MSVSIHFNDLESLIGKDIGSTDWMTITQERINTFADATDDPQWIHVDPVRAKAGPFGDTIAHGYLTLSLIVPLFTDLLECDGVTSKVNYGLNKVRFPAPVKVNSNIRLAVTIVDVQTTKDGGKEITFDGTVEVEGLPRPACVAQPVFRFYG
ncbi:MAG: MaoC family dehydratase [Dermatophilaceae bacterium]